LLHLFEELRVIDLRLPALHLARAELVEDGHQHKGHDQPDTDTLK
jgi:hypothetical protein